VKRFDEPCKTACFWGVNETSKDGHVYDPGLCKFVENFPVFPTSYLRRRKGSVLPERNLQNMNGEKMVKAPVKLTNSTIFADENLKHASYTKETWDPHWRHVLN